MAKPRKIAKLVIINVFVGLVMIWSLNLLAAMWLDGVSLHRAWFPPGSKKAKSPSLEDRELAQLIYREKDLLRTRYVPYVAWSRHPFQGQTITVGEGGDRVHASTTEDPVGHVRFFGGSTMWGSGVVDADTIPAQFNRLHPDYQVHNHGETGFVSRQGLDRLINLVNRGAPMDMVVFYDGCNDIVMCRPDVSINGHMQETKVADKLKPKSLVVEDMIGPLRTLVSSIYGDLNIRVNNASLCQKDPEHARSVAAALLSNWKIAKAVAELGGAEFHAVLQPVAVVGKPNLEYLADLKPRKKRKTNRQVLYAATQEILRQENIGWIHDFTDVFDIDDYVYIDACHVNALGNELVAKRLDTVIGHQLPAAGR